MRHQDYLQHHNFSFNIVSVLSLVLFLALFSKPVIAVPAQDDQETDPLVLQNLEKFQDLKFGLFIHCGLCSQLGGSHRLAAFARTNLGPA